MKRNFLILFFGISINFFAQNFSFNGDYEPDLYSTIHYFNVSDNIITYKYESKKINKEISVNYKKIYIDGLLFLQMSNKFPYSIAEYYENNPTSDTMLVLAGKHISENNSKTLFLNGEILFFAELL